MPFRLQSDAALSQLSSLKRNCLNESTPSAMTGELIRRRRDIPEPSNGVRQRAPAAPDCIK
jgi:hypothetical protein